MGKIAGNIAQCNIPTLARNLEGLLHRALDCSMSASVSASMSWIECASEPVWFWWESEIAIIILLRVFVRAA